MKKRGKYFLAVIILGLGYIFMFKAEWLTISLLQSKSFPLGTLISWFLIFAFSLYMFLGIPLKPHNPVEKFMKSVLLICLAMAVFWGVFSYLMAENWAFVFKQISNFYIWGFYTAFIILIPLIVILILGIRRITGR